MEWQSEERNHERPHLPQLVWVDTIHIAYRYFVSPFPLRVQFICSISISYANPLEWSGF